MRIALMGKDSPQLRLRDIEGLFGKPVVDPKSFYGRLADEGSRLLPDEAFSALYKDSGLGRPSIPPSRLAKALLLMYHDNVSDREAEQRAAYDLRWKVALNLALDEKGFDHTSLCKFRSQLLRHDQHRVVFERFIELAVEAGLVKGSVRQIVDSTHILGAGAVQDTYMLIRSAIRKLLRLTRHQHTLQREFAKLLQGRDYKDEGKPDIDWEDPAARRALLNELVQDGRELLQATEGVKLYSGQQAARELLAAVIAQDVEEQPDGSVEIRQGVAKDRIISTSDPEERHGHRTSRGRFDGFKAHVALEPESGLVTNVAVTPGNVPDAAALPAVVDQQSEALKPKQIVADTAYGPADARIVMQQRQVEIIAPVQPQSNGGRFTKSDFAIDLSAGTCRCPAGELAAKVYRSRTTGAIVEFRFDAATCLACTLRAHCIGTAEARAVRLHRHEEVLQRARAYERTPEFKDCARRATEEPRRCCSKCSGRPPLRTSNASVSCSLHPRRRRNVGLRPARDWERRGSRCLATTSEPARRSPTCNQPVWRRRRRRPKPD